jgi:hypothetical protein
MGPELADKPQVIWAQDIACGSSDHVRAVLLAPE